MVFVPLCGLMGLGLVRLGLVFDHQKHYKWLVIALSATLTLLAAWAGLQRYYASFLDAGGGG